MTVAHCHLTALPSPAQQRQHLGGQAITLDGSAAGAVLGEGSIPGSPALRARPEPWTARLNRLAANPPTYLLRTLGPPPPGGPALRAWRSAAAAIEQYRRRFGVSDPCQPFGADVRLEGAAMRIRTWELICDARQARRAQPSASGVTR